MKQIISFLILFIPLLVIGQDIKTSDFTEEISKYDISDLLTLNESHIENDNFYRGTVDGQKIKIKK